MLAHSWTKMEEVSTTMLFTVMWSFGEDKIGLTKF